MASKNSRIGSWVRRNIVLTDVLSSQSVSRLMTRINAGVYWVRLCERRRACIGLADLLALPPQNTYREGNGLAAVTHSVSKCIVLQPQNQGAFLSRRGVEDATKILLVFLAVSLIVVCIVWDPILWCCLKSWDKPSKPITISCSSIA